MPKSQSASSSPTPRSTRSVMMRGLIGPDLRREDCWSYLRAGGWLSKDRRKVPVATAFSRQPLGQRGGECLDPVRTPIRRKHFRAMLKCRRDMLADRQVVQGAGAGADREYGVVVAEV